VQQQDQQPSEVLGKDIRLFQQTISESSSYDFSQYSHTSLRRRLTRILLEKETDMEGLTRRMKSDPFFLEEIVNKLTVHTTELFRDPEIWKKIRNDLLPSMMDRSKLRIWHPGCSTGQEVFSMIMLLDAMEILDKTEIYGTDINPHVIEKAKSGTYKYRFNQSYLQNFNRVIYNEDGEPSRNDRKRWKKYFHIDEASDVIKMTDYVRSKPVFQRMDLVMDTNPFYVKFDLIVCRNVIIYFNSELQNRVFDLFYQNMTDYAALILGVHESILGPFTKRFIKKDPFYLKAPL
jgi:chemotaxis protein methyltransferase CheR